MLFKKISSVRAPAHVRGGITIMVLVMLVAFVVILSAFLRYIALQSHLTSDKVQEEQAFGFGDAGVNYAVWLLAANGARRTPADLENADPGTDPDLFAATRNHKVCAYDKVTKNSTCEQGETEIGEFTLAFHYDPPPIDRLTVTSEGKDINKPGECQTVVAVLAKFADGGYHVVNWDHKPTNVCSNPLSDATLVGYWKFDEGKGDTTRDETIPAERGDLKNMFPPSPWVAPTGIPTKFVNPFALNFDGQNDNVDIRTDAELDNFSTTGFTVSAWMKPDVVAGTTGVIIEKRRNTHEFYLIRRGEQILASVNGNNTCGADVDFAKDTWYHVAAVYTPAVNPPTSPASLSVYKNGKLVKRCADASAIYTPGTGRIGIGQRIADGRFLFDGLIDDVRIYRRPLSTDEIGRIADGY